MKTICVAVWITTYLLIDHVHVHNVIVCDKLCGQHWHLIPGYSPVSAARMRPGSAIGMLTVMVICIQTTVTTKKGEPHRMMILFNPFLA